mgnify:CR=1 FL=1|tara:strand:- start:1307 stop:3160 length:1854 start_codon:yes stop_codon:yes gene_type:complete
MHFLYPQLGWLGLLAIVPIALYLFRRRSKSVEVSTLVFFKSVAREHQESDWLRKLKRLVSLLLTLLLLLAAVFSLARIVSSSSNNDTRSVVIVLDRSASMAAQGPDGRTRLEIAKEAIISRLESLPPGIGVSLVTYDSRAEILQPRTLKRRSLVSELERVQVRPTTDNFEAALETAKILAELESPSEIWQVSDSVQEFSPEGHTTFLPISVALQDISNVGFTAFQIRKLPLESSRYTAFVQVSCNPSAPEPVKGLVEVRVGGIYLAPRQYEIAPGETIGFELPIEGAQGQLLQLTLQPTDDCLPLDNFILVPLPTSQPIVAAHIGSSDTIDPFTQLALQSLIKEGDLQVWSVSPEKWPMKNIDVAIFDNWLPEEWPTDVPAIVINPPKSVGPVHAFPLQKGGIPHRDIRLLNANHPVVFRVAASRLALTQTCILNTGDTFEPLWLAGDEPVLAAGASDGQRVVLMAFSPQYSERLPLTASFPLLLGNAIYWCADEEENAPSRSLNQTTGGVVPVLASEVTWTSLSGERVVSTTEKVDNHLLDLQRSGIWKTNTGQQGTAHLLSINETMLSGSAEATPQLPPSTATALPRMDILTIILAVALFILIVESALFHWLSLY